MTADNASELLDVVIVGFDVNDDGTILAGLGRVFKMDEVRGRQLLDNLPSTIARQVPEVRARYLLRALRMIHARVEIRDASGNTVELKEQAPPKPAPAPAATRPKPKPKPTPADVPPPKPDAAPAVLAPATAPAPGVEAALRLPTAPTALSAPSAAQVSSPSDVTRPRASRTTLSEGQPIPPALAAQLAATERPPLPPPPAATAQLSASDLQPPVAGAPMHAEPSDAVNAPMPGHGAGTADPDESMVGGWGALGSKDPSYISPPSPVAARPAIAAPLPPPQAPPPPPPLDDTPGEDRLSLDPMGATAASQGAPGYDRGPDPLAMTAPQPKGDAGAPGKPAFDALNMSVPKPNAHDHHAPDPLALTAPQPKGDLGAIDRGGFDPLALTAPQPAPGPEDAGARNRQQAPPGFTHGGLEAPSADAAAGEDGNIAFEGGDDRLSLAPPDEVGGAAGDDGPMEVLTGYEQPSRESVDGYRHPVARSGEVPGADSALAAAAHPGYQRVERDARDTRPFWATIGEAMTLPFMGTGTGWVIAIALWSAVVGAVSVLFDIIPGTPGTIIGGLCTVWLFGSVVAFAADYYRTCVWAVLRHHEAPTERPALALLYGEYLGNAVHFVFFGLLAFMPLLGWSYLQLGDDDSSTRAFVTSPITLLLLAAPNLYFPMALATAALGNRASAIWHVGFGINALSRAPLEYAAILVASTCASLLAAAPCVIAGAVLELQGWFFLATLGFPLAISSGIQGGLMGHLMRARPETFGE